jgi:hypothetical protein
VSRRNGVRRDLTKAFWTASERVLFMSACRRRSVVPPALASWSSSAHDAHGHGCVAVDPTAIVLTIIWVLLGLIRLGVMGYMLAEMARRPCARGRLSLSAV